MADYPRIKGMTDRELLEELVTEKRNAEKRRKIYLIILLIVLAVIIVLGFIYIPRLIVAVERYTQMMDEMGESAKEFKEFSDTLPSVDEAYDVLVERIIERLRKMLNPFG